MTSSEQHPNFLSGDWESFYNVPRGSRPRGEITVILDFSNGRVKGSGSDPVGV